MCDSSAGDGVDNRGGHWETPVWVWSSVPGAWMSSPHDKVSASACCWDGGKEAGKDIGKDAEGGEAVEGR